MWISKTIFITGALRRTTNMKRSALTVRNSRSAFTLVEMLVAIALFSVVVSIAVGGFTRALRTQRQVIALIAANSNMSLALEQMAREMRTSINFSCVEWFDRAVEERDQNMMPILSYAHFDPLRSDARFQDLLRHIGLLR